MSGKFVIHVSTTKIGKHRAESFKSSLNYKITVGFSLYLSSYFLGIICSRMRIIKCEVSRESSLVQPRVRDNRMFEFFTTTNSFK